MKKILLFCLIVTLYSCNSKKSAENESTEQNVSNEIIKTDISGTYHGQYSKENNNKSRTVSLIISELEDNTYLLKFNGKSALTAKRSGNVLTGQISMCPFTIEFINEFKTANFSACADYITFEKD